MKGIPTGKPAWNKGFILPKLTPSQCKQRSIMMTRVWKERHGVEVNSCAP